MSPPPRKRVRQLAELILLSVSSSPGVSVTSSNTGVPDISGSVYSKTQVGTWLWIKVEKERHREGGVALIGAEHPKKNVRKPILLDNDWSLDFSFLRKFKFSPLEGWCKICYRKVGKL